MFLLYLALASITTAISNLFIRKSTDARKEFGGDPFLPQRLLSSVAVIALFSFVGTGKFSFDVKMTLLGIVSGIFLGTLMWATGRSVNRGPSGLSFSIINAACVVPPIIMVSLFGIAYGFDYTIRNAFGAVLVVFGLLWMGYGQDTSFKNQYKKWLFWVLLSFTIHVLHLTFFQWRALLMNECYPSSPLLPFVCDPEKGDGFMISMFLVAALIQKLVSKASFTFTFSDRPLWKFGVVGGLFNGIGGYFMIKATETAATPIDKATLFPLFCIGVIFLCNLWGNLLFKEKIKWIASGVCFAGIFISLF
jgi:hypothetical protein